MAAASHKRAKVYLNSVHMAAIRMFVWRNRRIPTLAQYTEGRVIAHFVISLSFVWTVRWHVIIKLRLAPADEVGHLTSHRAIDQITKGYKNRKLPMRSLTQAPKGCNGVRK